MKFKPKSRIDNLLAKIAGQADAKKIDPKTKGEYMLNKISDSGRMTTIVTEDSKNGVLNKTWREIHNALQNGPVVIAGGAEFSSHNYIVLLTTNSESNNEYNVYAAAISSGEISIVVYRAANEGQYPSPNAEPSPK